MILTRTKVLAAGAVLAMSLAACADEGGGGGSDLEAPVVEDPNVEEGSTAADLAGQDEITIGIKTDQPGTGFLEPGADVPTGFDIEVAKYIAGQLGFSEDQIAWEETVSDNREPFLENGTVDLVAATYSITEERLAIVGQAGPYYVTGQQLLVSEEDKEKITGPDDLGGVSVCSVTGSTSLETVQQEYGAKPKPFDTYSACVRQLLNGTVDSVTTDGAILLGFAAQDPENLEVVGPVFSEERYGVGYFPPDDTATCQFITDAIQSMYDDGYWKKAFESTLGEAGVETPAPPEPDPCS